jgi:hypothetical protein
MLDSHPKLIAIDKKTDDEIVHPGGFRQANSFSHYAFDPGAEREMFAFQLLRRVFSSFMQLGSHMSLVRSPAIGVQAPDPKRHEQRLQF